MVAEAVVVVVPVCVAVPAVVVRLAEDQRARQVDDQAKRRDRHCLRVVDGSGRQQPLHRTDRHQRGDAEQEQGAGVAAQHLDLPGAEGEARVVAVAPRAGVGERGQPQRQRMRAHVPAVGQQRHRVEPPAAGDLQPRRLGDIAVTAGDGLLYGLLLHRRPPRRRRPGTGRG